MSVDLDALRARVDALIWYHTIDLGHGVRTPGIFDHQPFLRHYGLPRRLDGRTALDVGAAAGFFSFELERRGAQVTATDLPTWMAHDFGPRYQPDLAPQQADAYLHDPFLVAAEARRSAVSRRLTTIYDISPETVGTHDLVFCGSVLLHLTDPVRALWKLRSVTAGAAIITTAIHPVATPEPLAQFLGQHRGDVWWLPNRAGFEAMVQAAGFTGWEWYSEFQLDYRDGTPGPPHGVIRAWTTPTRPAWLDDTDPR